MSVQLCNPLHTDFTDLLNDRPCVVVVSESDLPERNNRLKAMMEAVSSHKALEGLCMRLTVEDTAEQGNGGE